MSQVQKQNPRDMDVTKNLKPRTQNLEPNTCNPESLRQLYALGQSPWYDNVERRLFKSGEFRRLIDEYGIVGVTSNPTIFDKAISSSADYDDPIRGLAGRNSTAHEIYDVLTMDDIAMAADMLSDVHKETKGVDGYVSIEVLPDYAYDAEKTVKCAKKLFKKLGRENILIKVPGTKEGLPAIRQLIADGVNVNVTLLFSVGHYESIAAAYINGLKDRLKKAQDLCSVTSVASVFVSRIDTKIDRMLEEMEKKAKGKMPKAKVRSLLGRAAVANSKIIYQRFKEIFWGDDFAQLKENGANIQRVLWASTSTKNPYYRDVKYVEELIGPDTINTMPHQTALAFRDHGVVKPSVDIGIDEAKRVIKDLSALGIDVSKVCEDLQKEGVKAFVDSFNSLISSIAKKVNSLDDKS